MTANLTLRKDDIIGRKIMTAYHEDGAKKQRFQDRIVIVRLDNGLLFNFEKLHSIEVEIDRNIVVESCGLKETYVPVLSIDTDKHLDSPIKALVYSDLFMHEVGILLGNNYVLTQYVGEWGTGVEFIKSSRDMLNSYIELTIAEKK